MIILIETFFDHVLPFHRSMDMALWVISLHAVVLHFGQMIKIHFGRVSNGIHVSLYCLCHLRCSCFANKSTWLKGALVFGGGDGDGTTEYDFCFVFIIFGHIWSTVSQLSPLFVSWDNARYSRRTHKHTHSLYISIYHFSTKIQCVRTSFAFAFVYILYRQHWLASMCYRCWRLLRCWCCCCWWLAALLCYGSSCFASGSGYYVLQEAD